MTEPKGGDIILYPVTPKSAWSSKLVVIGEILFGAGKGLEHYSHVGIVSDTPGYQFEAVWPRVCRSKIDKSRPYEIWRIEGLDDMKRREILAFCRARCGEWYNMIGLLTFGLIGFKHTEVCSQFAGFAYASVGIKISAEGKRLLSPNAIADYPGARMILRVGARA